MDNEAVWYYSVEGTSQGPVAIDVLRAMAASGQLSERDHVFRDGWDDWVQAQDVGEIWAEGVDVPSSLPEGDDLVVQPRAAEAGDIEYDPGPAAGTGMVRGQVLAISSAVLGGISIVTCGGCLFGIISIVLGFAALKDLEDSVANGSWRMVAWVGIVLSGVSLLFLLAFFALAIVGEFA